MGVVPASKTQSGWKKRRSVRSIQESFVRLVCFLCAAASVVVTFRHHLRAVEGNVDLFPAGFAGRVLHGNRVVADDSPGKIRRSPSDQWHLADHRRRGLHRRASGPDGGRVFERIRVAPDSKLPQAWTRTARRNPDGRVRLLRGFFVTPLLRKFFDVEVFNAASGAIVVGIMILPLVSSLCEEALRAVPKSLREAAYGMGSTKLEVTLKVVLPAALSGVMASFILALSRAIGETMAVTLAAGSTPRMTLNPAESIQTMTAFIVQISRGDTPAGTTPYYTLFAVALTLFVMTLAMNMAASMLVKRFRQVYH